MDCILIKNYFLELLDRIFYWTESAQHRQTENLSNETRDLIEDKEDFSNNNSKSEVKPDIIKTI